MLPYGQAVQHAAKAGSPQHDIHVVMRLNAPSMALLPHFCDMLHGSIEKGGNKNPNPSPRLWRKCQTNLRYIYTLIKIRTYAKVFQQGKVPKTVHSSTARRFNAAGAVLRKS
jgi:hypothetical protein